MVRYAVSMGIRMVCFVLAVILQNWMTWVLLALAVVLPYVAVTTANVGGDRYMRRSESEDLDARPLLGTAHEEGEPAADRQWWETEEQDEWGADSATDTGSAEIISGELVDGDELTEQPEETTDNDAAASSAPTEDQQKEDDSR